MANRSADELRYMIDEETHKLFHLNRSQSELKQALEESPTDADFIQAISENADIILEKESKIIELQKQLEQCDPAFRIEMRRQREAIGVEANVARSNNSVNVSVPVETADNVADFMFITQNSRDEEQQL